MMTPARATADLGSPPDRRILRRVEILSVVALIAVAAVAGTVLAGWLIGGVGAAIPHGWARMQATTASAALLLALGLGANRRGQVSGRIVNRVAAAGAILLAIVELVTSATGWNALGGAGWVADGLATAVQPMSLQSGVALLLLGASAIIAPAQRRALGHVADALLLLLVLLSLIFVSGHLFEAQPLVAQSSTVLISPQTVACVALLTLVLAGRRAPHGAAAVLVGGGIAGHMARVLLVVALVVSYAVIAVGEGLIVDEALTLPEAAAATSAAMAGTLIIVVILMARRLDGMERQLRATSLVDELTGIYNRRGFFLLGEQATRDARRSGTPAQLLFFDVDGLKRVNDTYGHDVGSQLLRDMATLLRDTFRDNDVLGRVGGDEFVLLAHGDRTDLQAALERLDAATAAVNAKGRPYRIAFSVGAVALAPEVRDSLADLLAQADALMYEDKQRRRAGRPSDPPGPGLSAGPPNG